MPNTASVDVIYPDGNPPMFRKMKHQSQGEEPAAFEDFEAASLYCPRCGIATPVRKRLLLVLPEGDKYEYLCARCATSLGSKIDYQSPAKSIIIKD
jgi:hypothetical protein